MFGAAVVGGDFRTRDSDCDVHRGNVHDSDQVGKVASKAYVGTAVHQEFPHPDRRAAIRVDAKNPGLCRYSDDRAECLGEDWVGSKLLLEVF